MRLVYTPEQLALRDELRAYFVELLPPEIKAQIKPFAEFLSQKRRKKDSGEGGTGGGGGP